MCIGIFEIIQVEVLRADSDIVLFVDPHCQRVPVSHNYPLPDVEFLVVDCQWVFNILLGDPLDVLAQYIVEQLVHLVERSDPPATGQASWFHNPDILIAI